MMASGTRPRYRKFLFLSRSANTLNTYLELDSSRQNVSLLGKIVIMKLWEGWPGYLRILFGEFFDKNQSFFYTPLNTF